MDLTWLYLAIATIQAAALPGPNPADLSPNHVPNHHHHHHHHSNEPTLHTCQTTLHCPPNTIIVSPDPTNPHANFTTLSSALTSLPEHPSSPRATILLLAGTYIEQINITRSAPITLLGQTQSPENPSSNLVRIVHNAANHDSTGLQRDNVFTSALIVAPTLAASLTGSGPKGDPVPRGTPSGNTDFRAYNVDFVNDWKPFSDGPALAVSLGYCNAGFYACGFFSYQDTVCLFPFSLSLSLSLSLSAGAGWLGGCLARLAQANEIGLRRQTRKHIHNQQHNSRRNRFSLRFRDSMDNLFFPATPKLRRRNHSVERKQHDV